MIHIDMTRQNTNHPDRNRRHQGRASCEAADRRFEAEGPAPVYKITTLLWLHGHGGDPYEVHDDIDPFGRPGGLALTGKVRNWARMIKGAPTFERKAVSDPDFSETERSLIARAAGRVTPSGAKGHTGASLSLDGPDYQRPATDAVAPQAGLDA